MACHTANLAFMALKLGLPTRVSAAERRDQPRDLSRLGDDHLRVPRPAATCRRSSSPGTRGPRDGKRNLPPPTCSHGLQALRQRLAARRLEGHDLLAQRLRLGAGALARGRVQGFKDPEPTLPRIDGGAWQDDNQKKEWVEAIRAGKPAIALSNFDYASTLTESMLLGNVAVRSGEAIDYDPATGQITNSSTASQYLKPYFRKGWEI